MITNIKNALIRLKCKEIKEFYIVIKKLIFQQWNRKRNIIFIEIENTNT